MLTGGSGRKRANWVVGEESVDRSEGSGERLLGLLLDRARLLPPQPIAPLIAEEVAKIGGREISILLQDYAQELLVPLPGSKLHVGQPEPMENSPAGRLFMSADVVEVPQAHGVRMYLPLLDGSDQLGVTALTLEPSTTTAGAGSPAWSPTCWSPRTPTPTSSSWIAGSR